MRVTTAFKRLLRLPGASRDRRRFSAEGVIVTVRLRRRRRVCSRVRADRPAACRSTTGASSAGGTSISAPAAAVIECELRRLRCRDCGVRLEPVPWARPGARAHARLRGRRRVAGAADGVHADHPAAAGSAGTRSGRSSRASSPTTSTSAASRAWSAIGVDEISYRRHHRYLTSVADHAHGRDRVVRAGPQQRHPAGASSTSSATARTRSGRSRST